MYCVERLASALQDAPGVILDCGAHIGAFSCLLAASRIRNSILAFEPEPDNYRLLSLNTTQKPTIVPINRAVGTANCRMRLFGRGNPGRWSMVPSDSAFGSNIEVDVVDLFACVREIGDVALMKLDLEGFEATILDSAPSDALRAIRLLIIESHHNPIDFDRLEAEGFELWYQPFGSDRHRVYVNLHALP